MAQDQPQIAATSRTDAYKSKARSFSPPPSETPYQAIPAGRTNASDHAYAMQLGDDDNDGNDEG